MLEFPKLQLLNHFVYCDDMNFSLPLPLMHWRASASTAESEEKGPNQEPVLAHIPAHTKEQASEHTSYYVQRSDGGPLWPAS